MYIHHHKAPALNHKFSEHKLIPSNYHTNLYVHNNINISKKIVVSMKNLFIFFFMSHVNFFYI